MATKKKILFSAIVYDPKFNHRNIDRELVDGLKKSFALEGLMDDIECTAITEASEDDSPETRYKIVDGAHRYVALSELRDSIIPEEIALFDRICSSGKIEVKLAEGDYEALHRRSVTHNTYRKQLEPWEVYAEAKRLTVQSKDQYEIAEILRVQQPRIAELLSFDKVVTGGHELWRAGILSNADMVKFATLDAEAQEEALKAFDGVKPVAGTTVTPKAAKAAKAAARKELGKTAKEKGNKRVYANAGKPTRQKLASYVPKIAVMASSARTADERAFYNALAAAFKVINGEEAFEKLSFEKSYVTKKDAAEAQKLLDAEAAKEAARIEKEAKKAEKAKAAKAAKPAKAAKAVKAPKPAKAAKAAKPVKAVKAAKPAKAPKKAAKAPAKAAKPVKAAKPAKAAKKAAAATKKAA